MQFALATSFALLAAGSDELDALTADNFQELSLFKGSVFFGHMNPDADSIGAAMAAAEFFRDGISACPMKRDKCPNAETAYLMDKFNVSLDAIPLLSEISDLSNRSIVLVDFNDVSKGPASTFDSEIPQFISSETGLWKTPPVVGVIDHHALQIDVQTDLPEFFYNKSGNLVIETHPWGCGTSIMALKFRESDRQPSRQVAGMMLGAILSDTLGLTSPNTTPYDEDAVDFLAPIAGVADVQQLYEAQAEAKSSEVLTKDLFEVFDGDLKTYETVPGTALVVIGSVEVYGKSIYDSLLAKPDEELYHALSQVQQKYENQYLEQVGPNGTVHSYVWAVDVKNFASTVISLSDGVESCIALHALDKVALPVLDEEKECRPDSPEPTTREGFSTIPTGSCVSRKSQLQPSLERAVKDFYDGALSCGRGSPSLEVMV